MMEHGGSECVKEHSKMEITIKIEVEATAASIGHIDSGIIDLNHLKQEPEMVQSVKIEPALFMKEELLENDSRAAIMEHSASESAKEQSQMEFTIKTDVDATASYSTHIDSKIDLNHLKQKRGLVKSVKGEPGILVKEEIPEYSQDDSEQKCVHDASISISTGFVNKAGSTSLGNIVKYESTEMDVGPSVLQRMDTHYTRNKNMSTAAEENAIVAYCSEAMPGSSVRKESIEEKWRDKEMSSHRYWAQKTTGDNFDESHMKSRLEQRKNFQQHILHQHGSASSNSSKSSKTYHKSHLLSEHNKLQQRKKTYQCNNCNLKYAQKGALNLHMRVHTGEKPYQCDNCDARFARKGVLSLHMRIHTGEKPYQCNYCDSRFAQKGDLKQHIKVHTGEKPYQCENCDSKFAQKGTLNLHMRVHTGERPYQCDNCNVRFARKGDLNRHMRVHSGERPYHCDNCDSRFAQKGALHLHMRVHTGEKPYRCENCDVRFSQKGHLNHHMRIHTDKEISAITKFAGKSTLKTSIKRRHSKQVPN